MEGRFSIIQDSKTERSWIRHQVGDEITLKTCPANDYPYLRLLSSLIRGSNEPEKLMKYVAEQISEDDDDEPIQGPPGFFIPPEELDGLEDEN